MPPTCQIEYKSENREMDMVCISPSSPEPEPIECGVWGGGTEREDLKERACMMVTTGKLETYSIASWRSRGVDVAILGSKAIITQTSFLLREPQSVLA